MEKSLTKQDHSHSKRMKNKQNKTITNNPNSHSGEKKKLASKEHFLKIKSSKLRHSNVKDFQGRRHDSRDNNVKSIWLESPKEEPQKILSIFKEKPVILLKKNKSSPSKELVHTHTSLKCIKPLPANNSNEAELVKNTFDDHMRQWAQQLCQPLVVPSTKVEFEMPYIYSEEFYSKLSAKSYMMQPFSSVEEPEVASNSYVGEWHEKAQLARQYYRQLCVQPSQEPIRMIVITRTVAQFVAEECALLGTELYFETFEEDNNILETIEVEGKKKHTIYIVSNNLVQKKLEAVARVKTENSICTESWQN